MPPFISKPTALGYAVMFSPVSEIKRLIAEGVDVNALFPYDGKTALIVAAKQGRCAAVHRLLAAGANPNHTDMRDNTALVYATHHSSTTALRMLLATAPAGEQISRALVRAAECGRVRAMTLLLAATNPLWPQQSRALTAAVRHCTTR